MGKQHISPESRKVIRNALNRELGIVTDDLLRYRMQANARPGMIFRDGSSVSQHIQRCEVQAEKIKKALQEIGK